MKSTLKFPGSRFHDFCSIEVMQKMKIKREILWFAIWAHQWILSWIYHDHWMVYWVKYGFKMVNTLTCYLSASVWFLRGMWWSWWCGMKTCQYDVKWMRNFGLHNEQMARGPLQSHSGKCPANPTCSLFTLRKPRSLLRINGEQGFLRVNRLYSVWPTYCAVTSPSKISMYPVTTTSYNIRLTHL